MGQPPLETIGLATLSYGAQPVQEGVCETWKGTIYTSTGDPTISFVKILPNRQLISEIVCALIGRAIGLKIPRPFLVKIDKNVLPNSQIWVAGMASCFGYGSEDAGLPNFKRAIVGQSLKNQSRLKSILQSWPDYRRVALFDELVANPDRHIGNLLFDGKDKFWLIDHSHALTGPNWTPNDLRFDAQVENILLQTIIYGLSLAEKQDWGDEAKIEALAYQDLDFPSLPFCGMLDVYAEVDQIQAAVAFLVERSKHFVSLACLKLGIPLLPI